MSSTSSPVREVPRTRDPQRRSRIVDAAADLISRAGYHRVSMADIGRHAGITGSGIYRHFDSKAEILLEVLEGAFDELDADQRRILEDASDAEQALGALIESQVRFTVGRRDVARVHYDELRNLPEPAQTRLRRKHRSYIERWAALLLRTAPELSDAEARTIVHATIGAIHSPRLYSVTVPDAVLAAHLTAAARAVLGIPTPVPPAPPSRNGATPCPST